MGMCKWPAQEVGSVFLLLAVLVVWVGLWLSAMEFVLMLALLSKLINGPES